MTRLTIGSLSLFALCCATHSYANVLHDAIEEENLPLLKEVLNRPHISQLFSEIDESGFPPLILAARKGQTEIVSHLVKNGANVDELNKQNETALIQAILYRHIDTAIALIDLGADLECQTQKGKTPLILATLYGLTEVVEALLAKGAQVDSFDPSQNTALHIAAQRGESQIVALLIQAGAKLDHTNSKGNSPIQSAIVRGHLDLATYMYNQSYRTPRDLSKTSMDLSSDEEFHVEYELTSNDYDQFVSLDSKTRTSFSYHLHSTEPSAQSSIPRRGLTASASSLSLTDFLVDP